MNHYITLGVCRGDADEEIKRAYSKIAKANHPDLHANDADKAQVMAEANIAWGILGNPATRNAYNKRQATLYGVCIDCESKGYVYKQRGFKNRVLAKCNVCNGAGTDKAEP